MSIVVAAFCGTMESLLTRLIQVQQSDVYIVYQSYAPLVTLPACLPACPAACSPAYLATHYCTPVARALLPVTPTHPLPPLPHPAVGKSLQIGTIHMRTHSALERVFTFIFTLHASPRLTSPRPFPASTSLPTLRMHFIVPLRL